MEEDEHIFIFFHEIILLLETREELEELMIASCLRNERESVHSWEDWLEKKRSPAFSRNFILLPRRRGSHLFFVVDGASNNAKWKDNTAKKIDILFNPPPGEFGRMLSTAININLYL